MRAAVITLVIAGILVIFGYSFWPAIINSMMPADSRPVDVTFSNDTVSDDEFNAIASDLVGTYPEEFDHIDRFRKAGIRTYEGPETCLQCHETAQIEDAETGAIITVDLMENLLGSAHYKFFTMEHPNVWGFNGELADNFPMGKIDRPCPKPGSFAFTAWAEKVELEDGTVYSEGCGQCHIGGQVQAPLGELMPGYRTTQAEKDAIDCLICHAAAYDMNVKELAFTDEGQAYWNQDRSMRAAMSVVTPTSTGCLRCHQHNFGGDIYIDEQGAEQFMPSQSNTGHDMPRIAHPGSKRGTPYSPSWDVHAAAGVDCIDCHTTQGHLIAKGQHTTTMMTNDLPDVDVACQNCHGDAPHVGDYEGADFYNEHIDRVACQTCHIPSLQEDNATRRDFNHPEFEEEAGIYVYTDELKATEPGDGLTYVWWNGDGSFLGNAIGDNPNGEDLYKFYNPQNIWPEFADFDYDGWYEETMRPIAKLKPSKLYVMKRFDGRQHIDLSNIGPFGGMYVPYNLPTYYTTGDPKKAAMAEMDKSMMGMMYGAMFKYYLMDKFISFMDVDTWDTSKYKDLTEGREMEPRWLPMEAAMEVSHAIRRDGALTCERCHTTDGVLDWEFLGYNEDDVEMYTTILE